MTTLALMFLAASCGFVFGFCLAALLAGPND